MRKAFFILVIITCAEYGYSAKSQFETSKAKIISLPPSDSNFTADQILKLKPSDIRRLTDEKITLKEVITLKFIQAKIKTAIRKDRTVDKLTLYEKDKKPFKWHWGGFFLGLLLPFGVGIIISALKKNKRKSDRVTSAAIGTAIISLVIIIIWLISIGSAI